MAVYGPLSIKRRIFDKCKHSVSATEVKSSLCDVQGDSKFLKKAGPLLDVACVGKY